MLIKFNPSGSRMVTSDLTGMVAIWRGINLLAYYKKDWAITHCLFCDINMEGGNKSNLGNLFLFAGRSGTVCLANDLNMCSDVCRVGGTIKALIFYQKEGSAIVITSTLLLVQFKINFSEKSTPERKVKLSISGEPENLSSIWIGSCLLATCSNENMIRFWHLEQDENYALTVFDVLNNEDGTSFAADKISSIVYDGRGRSLVAGTRDGRLLFWKNMALGSESPVDKEQWSPQPFLNLGKSIQLLTVGKNNGVIVCKQADG
jgi:intraflagellar transport protein 140